jgi:hypothetical protein
MPEPEVEVDDRPYPVALRVYYKKFDDPNPGTEYMREFPPSQLGEAEWDFYKSCHPGNGRYNPRRTTIWSSGNEN